MLEIEVPRRQFRAILVKGSKKGPLLRLGFVENPKNLLTMYDRSEDRETLGACRFSVNKATKQIKFYGQHGDYGPITSREDFEIAVQNYKNDDGMNQYKLAQSLTAQGLLDSPETNFTDWEFIPPETVL